jgi:hypothetical protein
MHWQISGRPSHAQVSPLVGLLRSGRPFVSECLAMHGLPSVCKHPPGKWKWKIMSQAFSFIGMANPPVGCFPSMDKPSIGILMPHWPGLAFIDRPSSRLLFKHRKPVVLLLMQHWSGLAFIDKPSSRLLSSLEKTCGCLSHAALVSTRIHGQTSL